MKEGTERKRNEGERRGMEARKARRREVKGGGKMNSKRLVQKGRMEKTIDTVR